MGTVMFNGVLYCPIEKLRPSFGSSYSISAVYSRTYLMHWEFFKMPCTFTASGILHSLCLEVPWGHTRVRNRVESLGCRAGILRTDFDCRSKKN